ncbi:hypothetical protein MJA45_22090 [Paenibacillus aurantius]|uniref:Uncharacterized protein n=1 Tax=Paenibacillus aurantius TaxID=2918900 RepID=A0AA96RC92_9BACL|nr:hypothetical protein [Paenibacillus aurantius]WNQ10285.1 hypothetical protein MJA45_22090 [Paenibacillus aurantius]
MDRLTERGTESAGNIAAGKETGREAAKQIEAKKANAKEDWAIEE